MKNKTIQSLFSAVFLLAGALSAAAQGTAAFTYQGKLTDRGSDANDVYDFQFNLYDVAAATYRRSFATNDVAVSNGVFNVTLDFGATWFDGRQLMMLVQVRPGNSTGNYTNLLPLVPILPAPYATYAAKAGSVATNSVLTPASITVGGGDLVLKASASDPGDLIFQTSGGQQKGRVWTDPATNRLYLSSSDSSPDLTIDSLGRVGIGTSTPVAPLDIYGNWTGEQGALRLVGDKPTLRMDGGLFTGDRSWIMHLGSYGPGSLQFFCRDRSGSWDDVITLTPGGNVGIGTPTPVGGLQVASGGLAVTGASSPFVGAGPGVFMESAWNGGNIFAYDYSQSTPRVLTLNAPGGNVGIGTLNPQSALHVYSDNNPATLRLQSAWGFGSGRIEFWSDPQGHPNEWRPGFIQSEDRGNFTGELVF
jgi:hypothetical protein